METKDLSVERLVPHEKNPRVDAAQVADLTASIREHGIQVPLVAAPQVGSEQLVVLAGHRRLTAALQLGFESVPVQVREDLSDARDQLAFMATENIHRDQLTAIEESRLFQDMLDLGWSQAEVAKHTALPRARVSERTRLGKLSDQAGERVHRGQISVEDALVIAEFSDDPESAQQLEQAVGTYHFDWEVSQARARRERAAELKKLRREIKKAGGREAAEGEDAWTLEALFNIGSLQPEGVSEPDWGDAEAVGAFQEALAEAHADCPGHCAMIAGSGFVWGCDQVTEQHGADDDAEAAAAGGASEPEPDPWDEISVEEFAAARIHREQHLARALPHLDAEADARDYMGERVLEIGWPSYGGESEYGAPFLQGITGVEGKARVRRVLASWPLSVLVILHRDAWHLVNEHRYLAEGRQGSSYWGEKANLRKLLERTGYEWSPAEQKAILLATGKAHDAPAEPEDTGDEGTVAEDGGDA